ncbi:MAG: MFS transporter [Sphingomonadales bacterium]|nr:MFS transporter [Sphingomonadales bacterium]
MADGRDHSLSLRERLTAPGATLAPFRYPAFRAIWPANLSSQFGSQIQGAAAAWLMTELTTSHRLIAAVGASTTLPVMLFGVLCGAIADNFDRRKVMLIGQWIMLIPSALLAALTFAGMVGPWLLLGCTMAVGIGFAVNGPSWQASVRAQVGTRDMPQAISLNTIAFNIARSVGPALGGILVALAGMSIAFAVNAASFIWLIIVLFRWRPSVAPPVRQPMLPSIRAGLAFSFGSDPIRRVLLRGFCVGVGAAGYQALLPAVVRDQLHGDEFSYGVVLGVFGLGSIVGALVGSSARRRFGTEVLMSAGIAPFVVTLPLISAIDSTLPFLPLSFLCGSGWVFVMTTINVAIQVRAPEAVLGRALSLYQAVTFGGMAFGAWLWGSAADWVNLSFALNAAALWLAAFTLVLRIFAPMPGPHEGRVDLG